MKTAAAWPGIRRCRGTPASGSGLEPSWKTGGSGTAAAADGVSGRWPQGWLLMLVVVRAAGTGHFLTVEGAVELHDRPRAVAVRWGHERLVGCRALEPCH